MLHLKYQVYWCLLLSVFELVDSYAATLKGFCNSPTDCASGCITEGGGTSGFLCNNNLQNNRAWITNWGYSYDTRPYLENRPYKSCAVINYDIYIWKGNLYCRSSQCPDGILCEKTVTCTDCQPGFYIKWNDCVCLPCPTGQICANSVISGTCPGGTYSFQGINCTQCSTTPCASNQYLSATCSGSNDKTCSPCPLNSFCNGITATPCNSVCAPGTYETTACTTSTNRVCAPCGSGYYCTGGTNRSACISTCPPGTYETSQCNSTSPRVCTPCELGYYCTGGTSRGSCGSCCAPGTYETSSCNSTSPRVCSPCDSGYYCTGGVERSACDPSCLPGTYETLPCNTTHNRVCSPCGSGYYCTGGANRYNCTSICLAGTYETLSCDATHDRICSSCDSGYYCLAGVGRQSCSAPCQSGTFESIACTNITNRACSVSLTVPVSCSSADDCKDSQVCPFDSGQTRYVYCNGAGGTRSQYYFALAYYGTYQTYDSRPIGSCSRVNQNYYVDTKTYCVNCADGQYCKKTVTCPDCSAGTYIETTNCLCKPCPPGFLCKNSVVYSTCPAGTYSIQGINCTQCSTVPCAANEYISVPCSGSNDKTCSPCAPDCGPGTYESIACTFSTNRVCSLCEPGFYCPGGVYKYPCNFPNYSDATGFITCKSCTLCTVLGQFRSNCGGMSAGVCNNCMNTFD